MHTQMRQELQIAAFKGALMLDRRDRHTGVEPVHRWYRWVDPRQLDMQSPDDCVLGQMWDPYWEWVFLDSLPVADRSCALFVYGFALSPEMVEKYNIPIAMMWDTLTVVWRDEIDKRRSIPAE